MDYCTHILKNPSKVKLGLEQIRLFDDALGRPSQAFKSIHVAGTNGKGSVSTKIAHTFALSGKKVGLFTSPHITCLRERIAINGTKITSPEMQVIEKEIEGVIDRLALLPTYFEYLTLCAFLYFAKEQVDLALFEVGMGGRLDATNIIDPICCVITSIGLDHTDHLGTTLEEIAFEKGGIIKQKVPVIIGPKAQPRDVFAKIAANSGSVLIQVEGSFASFELENQAIAKKTLQQLGVAAHWIDAGVKKSPPCRFETILDAPHVILDVCHNVAAMQALFLRLPQKKIRVVAAFSKDKSVEQMVAFLEQKSVTTHLCPFEHERAFSPSTLQTNCQVESSLEEGLRKAFERAEENQEVLLICGTFFMMDEARRFFESRASMARFCD